MAVVHRHRTESLIINHIICYWGDKNISDISLLTCKKNVWQLSNADSWLPPPLRPPVERLRHCSLSPLSPFEGGAGRRRLRRSARHFTSRWQRGDHSRSSHPGEARCSIRTEGTASPRLILKVEPDETCLIKEKRTSQRSQWVKGAVLHWLWELWWPLLQISVSAVMAYEHRYINIYVYIYTQLLAALFPLVLSHLSAGRNTHCEMARLAATVTAGRQTRRFLKGVLHLLCWGIHAAASRLAQKKIINK